MFFFKQKTAYEMRISDWSSDVCSSDLTDHGGQRGAGLQPEQTDRGGDRQFEEVAGADQRRGAGDAMGDAALPVKQIGQSGIEIGRASCRERGVSTCRYRWSPSHYKKNKYKERYLHTRVKSIFKG